MKKMVTRKFEHWRQQPEHVRLRIATLLTAASGGILLVVWMTVLLPLQLYFVRGGNDDAERETAVPVAQEQVPQVGGVQDTSPVLPATLPPLVPSPTASTSPSPTPPVQQLPVEVAPPAP